MTTTVSQDECPGRDPAPVVTVTGASGFGKSILMHGNEA